MTAQPPPPSEAVPPPQPAPEALEPIAEEQPDQQGPDGRRVKQLRMAFMRALDKSLSQCSYDNFAKCFPRIQRENDELLKQAHERMAKYMKQRPMEEFEMILENRSAVSSLNALDRLLDDAETRRKAVPPDTAPPPTPSILPPRDIAEAHVVPLLRMAREREQARLDETIAESEVLKREVEDQRTMLKELLKKLREAKETFAIAGEEVARVSRGVEGEI